MAGRVPCPAPCAQDRSTGDAVGGQKDQSRPSKAEGSAITARQCCRKGTLTKEKLAHWPHAA